MVERIEKKYDFYVDKKSHSITYNINEGDNLSCFLKSYAKSQNYESSDNKITNEEWAKATSVLKERQKLTDLNNIRAGKSLTISENVMDDVMYAMGMSHPQKACKKQPESWNDIETKYQKINSLHNDEAKVIAWHRTNSDNNNRNYVVVDKSTCRAKVYSAEGKELTSFEVGVGRQKGDDYLKKDRAMTTAGVYTIDYKGSGRDAYAHKYNANIFTLKTDKGASGVALHQIPNKNTDRYAKMGNGDLADNRYSNGCVNFTKNDFKKMEKYIGVGTQVYILPEDKNNTFIVKNGQINLTQKKFTGQVLTSLQNNNPKVLKIDFKNHALENDSTKKFTNTLQLKKLELMKKLNIDNDTYNNLAKLSLGIAGQESNYGKSFKYWAKENFPNVVSFFKKVLGNKSCNSKGLTQMKIKSYTDPKTKKLLAEYKINENNLSAPENSAIATMIVLSSMYKNELPSLTNKLESLKMNKMDAMLYLWNGKKKEITKNTATPAKNIYLANVKKYSYSNFELKQA